MEDRYGLIPYAFTFIYVETSSFLLWGLCIALTITSSIRPNTLKGDFSFSHDKGFTSFSSGLICILCNHSKLDVGGSIESLSFLNIGEDGA